MLCARKSREPRRELCQPGPHQLVPLQHPSELLDSVRVALLYTRSAPGRDSVLSFLAAIVTNRGGCKFLLKARAPQESVRDRSKGRKYYSNGLLVLPHPRRFLRIAPVGHDHDNAALRVPLSSLSQRSKDIILDDLNRNLGMIGRMVCVCRHTRSSPCWAHADYIIVVRGCCPSLWRLTSFSH
jgi:hypothetical protein